MAYTLITAPSSEPVSLAEAKLHLRVDGSDDDARITAFISAARHLAEQKTGRAFAPQTWEIVLDAFPEAFTLYNAPITAVTSLKYIDEAGIEQTLAAESYQLDKDSLPGYVVPAYGYTWPTPRAQANAVRLRYTCGHATSDADLAALKMWMLVAISTWYKHSAATTDGNPGELPRSYLDGLLDRYKLYA
ncbi:MAG: head-tail connector protein [Mizugakiibacter sp.]|uniref:head-tail connector protein n=1 Tax=Mizugakiibacter sp. TaxID=1972610 RepID=UPI00320EB527